MSLGTLAAIGTGSLVCSIVVLLFLVAMGADFIDTMEYGPRDKRGKKK